jgi:hypothetical protein
VSATDIDLLGTTSKTLLLERTPVPIGAKRSAVKPSSIQKFVATKCDAASLASNARASTGKSYPLTSCMERSHAATTIYVLFQTCFEPCSSSYSPYSPSIMKHLLVLDLVGHRLDWSK